MWCMGPKIGMGDEYHRYSKHTEFHQNPRGEPYDSLVIWHGMTHHCFKHIIEYKLNKTCPVKIFINSIHFIIVIIMI